MTKKLEIGDIVEVQTGKGKAYVQFSHDARRHGGALIRVLPGLHQHRPDHLDQLAAGPELYFTIFPLKHALAQRLVTKVGHQPVPESARPFPLMRAPGWYRDGKVLDWWLCDGENEWRIGQLTPEQEKLSIRAIWPLPWLIEMLEDGWLPWAESPARPIDPPSSPPPIGGLALTHMLYFSSKSIAESALASFDQRHVKIGQSDFDGKWLVKVDQQDSAEMVQELGQRLRGIADSFGGEYDGWEMAVS